MDDGEMGHRGGGGDAEAGTGRQGEAAAEAVAGGAGGAGGGGRGGQKQVRGRGGGSLTRLRRVFSQPPPPPRLVFGLGPRKVCGPARRRALSVSFPADTGRGEGPGGRPGGGGEMRVGGGGGEVRVGGGGDLGAASLGAGPWGTAGAPALRPGRGWLTGWRRLSSPRRRGRRARAGATEGRGLRGEG